MVSDRTALRTHFKRLDELFACLMPLLPAGLPADRLALINEFREHGEYGLALEYILNALDDSRSFPGGEALDLMIELADAMEMSEEAVRLRGLRETHG